MDKYNDGVYTRYAWTEKQFKELVKKLQEKKQVKETKEVETK
jgi:Na+/melibiose symporter-like transporter